MHINFLEKIRLLLELTLGIALFYFKKVLSDYDQLGR
jgi:hypothetical protein